MKTKLLVGTIALGALMTASAQQTGDVIASPKLKQFFAEQQKTSSATTIGVARVADDHRMLPPKARELWGAKSAVAWPSGARGVSAGAKVPSCSGYRIVASPRLLELWPAVANQCCASSACRVACAK